MNTGLEDSVFFKLVRVVNLTARPFRQRVGRQHQLTLNEWRAMAALGAQPGLTATQVADLTGLDKMAVSRALAGLQRHKRLHRHEDPTDLRRSRLYLSSIGKALYATVSLQARERESELFAGVDPAELEAMNATLDKLISSVAGTVECGAPA
ncbi:MarR family winged helix-turn-helix transcriptional regulator [Variovorax sp. J2P1-59]|uniref:MarR family winged helix-turn-helix transcriptional regulator n=1 Tax=Variovorax flavidus TaxID=3053501 RepID=UPI002576E788|nr:MarR family winged helix-turn-helix transcriptional regulator [Variovorax sp. J2P1-59]MDM0078375.1 MarR family winged helix-turn-helix transcriptional regulator [Variovorax sp. J2P1-59]